MGRELRRVPLTFPANPTDAQIRYVNSYIKPKPSWTGYQMWQTVSDRPYTPTFTNAEELARWCADHPWGMEVSYPVSYETWLRFINGPGWAPSMMGEAGKVTSGVEFMAGEPASNAGGGE